MRGLLLALHRPALSSRARGAAPHMAKKKTPTAGERPAPRWQVSRRDFLRYTGIATAIVATPTFLVACGKDGEILGATEAAIDVSNLAVEWSIDVKRREDLLVLNFGFVNL